MKTAKRAAKRVKTSQLILRLPDELKLKFWKMAEENATSMNFEIVQALQKYFEEAETNSDLLNLVEDRRDEIASLPELVQRIEHLEQALKSTK